MLYILLKVVDGVKDFTTAQLAILAIVDVTVTTLVGVLGWLFLSQFWEAWFSYPLL